MLLLLLLGLASCNMLSSIDITTWELLGAARIAGRTISLTPDAQNKAGAAVAGAPAGSLGIDWYADVTLRLHGSGLDLVGDGVGIWYTRDRLQLRRDGLFGASARYAGIAVLCATFTGQNQVPRLSMIANDGTEFVSSRPSGEDFQSSLHSPAGCNLNRKIGGDSILSLRVSARDAGHRVDLFYYVDTVMVSAIDRQWTFCTSIPETGVRLLSGGYFGVSASTSDLTSAHDLLSFSVLQGVAGLGMAEIPSARYLGQITLGSAQTGSADATVDHSVGE